MSEPDHSAAISHSESTGLGAAALSEFARAHLGIKIKIGLLVALALVHVGITFWHAAPGPLSVDEAIYHWMAKSFSDSGSLDVWNGYAEFPSPELHHRYIRAQGDKLFPQYPSLFAIFAFPFYRIFGFFGLFVMNSASFVGVVLFSFLAAWRLFDDIDLALNACLILVLATFAWEYSQAAWPHAIALFFVMAAFFLGVEAYYALNRRQALLLAAASGAVGTIGLGMRLDGIFVFPALVLPFLFARPWRPFEALMVGLGTIPALVPLAAINYVKFGVLDPFSYGSGPGVQVVSPWPVLAAATVVLFAWACTRPVFTQRLGRMQQASTVGVGIAAILLLLLITPAGILLVRTVADAYIGIVDIRAFPTDVVVAVRSAGGGVLYVGAHKKALLQSLPYLALLLVPALRMTRRDADFTALAILFLTPMTVIGFYSYSIPVHDTGGLCLNTRYFLPGLPFIAILCAYAVRDLQDSAGMPWPAFWIPVAGCVSAALFFVLVRKLAANVNDQEFPLLVLPLWMAGALAVFVLGSQVRNLQWARLFGKAALVVAVAAMTWAGVVAIAYDYPAHRFARAVHHFFGEVLLKNVPTDSILFADNKTFAACTAVIDKEKVRIAFPVQDRFEDFQRLLGYQLRTGHRAFALFHNKLWEELEARGMLGRVQVVPTVELHNFTLSELVPLAGGADGRSTTPHP